MNEPLPKPTNAEHLLMLKDLLTWETSDLIAQHNRKLWLRFIAEHYKTLKLVGVKEAIPDEIMAELILERLI